MAKQLQERLIISKTLHTKLKVEATLSNIPLYQHAEKLLTQFSFEKYLINNIDGVNQDNVKDIIETLIDNQAFEDMLKVSVETVLQKDSDVHPMTMQEQFEGLGRVAKLMDSFLPSTQDFFERSIASEKNS